MSAFAKATADNRTRGLARRGFSESGGLAEPKLRRSEGWCRRRDLNPRPPAYEAKIRNARQINNNAAPYVRMRVRTGFIIGQIFSGKCTPEYCGELQRTTCEAGDCNHKVTRKITTKRGSQYASEQFQRPGAGINNSAQCQVIALRMRSVSSSKRWPTLDITQATAGTPNEIFARIKPATKAVASFSSSGMPTTGVLSSRKMPLRGHAND